jgi:hypothetical protein
MMDRAPNEAASFWVIRLVSSPVLLGGSRHQVTEPLTRFEQTLIQKGILAERFYLTIIL